MNLTKFDGVTLAKSQVTAIITDSLNKAMENGILPKEEIRPFVVEIPQDLKNGDYSTNVAMVNSKVFRSNPRAIATAILENMDFTGTFFEKAEHHSSQPVPGCWKGKKEESKSEADVLHKSRLRARETKPTLL